MSEIIYHNKKCEFYDHEYGLCGFQTIEVDEHGRCVYRIMTTDEYNRLIEYVWEKLLDDLNRISKNGGKSG